jgi:predicted dehydrogenase
MDGRVRVALVGCGSRGQSLLEVLVALRDKLDLVAVCDTDRECLRSASDLSGATIHASHSVRDLLRHCSPNLAVVSMPPHLSPEVSRTLLQSGVSVLTEVPPAFAGPLLEGALNAARKSSAHFGAAENYTATPLEQLKQKLISKGVFGEIERAEVNGSLGHKGHEIAIARSYIGWDESPVRVKAQGEGRYPGRTAELIAVPGRISGVVEFSSGAQAHFELSPAKRDPFTPPTVGLKNEFFGSLGLYQNKRFFLRKNHSPGNQEELELHTRFHEVDGVEVIQQMTVNCDPPVSWQNPFADRTFRTENRLKYLTHLEDSRHGWEIAIADQICNMVAAIQGEGAPQYPAERAIMDVRIRLAMLESSRRGGEWIPWQDEPFPIERQVIGMTRRVLRRVRYLTRRT